MIDKLPCQLTKGVTATREGLVAHDDYGTLFCDDGEEEWYEKYEEYNGATVRRLIPWPDAAERLRYRDGEPWCVDSERDNGLICDTTTPAYHGTPSYLHRLAAILCDDAQAFLVLHWCVTNLGGQG